MGLDIGLESAGFNVRVAVESNKSAAATIRLNRPDVAVIEKDIHGVTTKEILKQAGLKVGETAIVSAGPSCQTFSTAGSRNSFNDPRGGLFHEFLRIVKEAKPRFFVMENVPGMLSAAIKHRPLKERGHGYPTLGKDEELGTAFALILKELRKTGYYIVFDVLNAADYGVPQCRERVIFIGSRDGENISIPPATHSSEAIEGKKTWVTIKNLFEKLKDPKPEFVNLPPKAKKYLVFVPQGGNWKDIPRRMQRWAMGKAYTSWGGRVGFFRRLSWDKPSPSLTTSPVSKATMLCHPTKLRPLSIKEYMAIQQFPKNWQFSGGTSQKYIQIGNAVPIGLGSAIGEAVRKAMRSRKRKTVRGVTCDNQDLLNRLQKRPRTMVNPARMRKVKNPTLTATWINKRSSKRHEFMNLLIFSIEKAKGKVPKPLRSKAA